MTNATPAKFDRPTLTLLHNNAKGFGTAAWFAGPHAPKGLRAKLDALVAAGYASVLVEGRYAITPAGEARLLDRSDVTAEQERAVASRAMRDHGRE